MDENRLYERYINNANNTSRPNMYCEFVDHIDWDVKKKWYIIQMYEVEDKDAIPVDEEYETRVTSIPEHNSIDPVNGTIVHEAYSTATVLTRKIWPMIKMCAVMTMRWTIVFDVPTDTVSVSWQDVTDVVRQIA